MILVRDFHPFKKNVDKMLTKKVPKGSRKKTQKTASLCIGSYYDKKRSRDHNPKMLTKC